MKYKHFLPVSEIFNVFQSNKPFLYQLIDKKILIPDESFKKSIISKGRIQSIPYVYLFYPSIKPFLTEKKTKTLQK